MIKDKLKEFTYRLFDSYYQIEDIDYHYSGLYIGYFEGNSNLKLSVYKTNGRVDLEYFKKDKDNIQKLIPISDYYFKEYVIGWFSQKFMIEIDCIRL
jgi:hypothetical protein